jgi:glycosyltransferase involved in cell wall biosynthesis
MPKHEDIPRISVIITTYNRAEMLPRAVNSVLAQTYRDHEIIIVDDYSTDHTQQVIAGFTDSRIRSFRHRHNRKQAASINTGIAKARGEYIAFLDDDDEWLPSKLERQAALLDSSPPKVGLVYGWLDEVNSSTGITTPSYRSTMEGDVFDNLLALEIPSPTSTLLVRLSAAREVNGFDTRLRRHIDNDFICRVSQRYHLAALPEVVARNHIDHGHSRISGDNPESLSNAAGYLRDHMDRFTRELDSRAKARAAVLRRLASLEMALGNRRTALSALANAARLDPLGVLRAVLSNARMATNLFVYLIAPPSHPKNRAR